MALVSMERSQLEAWAIALNGSIMRLLAPVDAFQHQRFEPFALRMSLQTADATLAY